MKLKKIFYLTLLAFFALASCGRKGALEFPGERQKPNFDKEITEN
jgi:predicted small lipoprotein YifL